MPSKVNLKSFSGHNHVEGFIFSKEVLIWSLIPSHILKVQGIILIEVWFLILVDPPPVNERWSTLMVKYCFLLDKSSDLSPTANKNLPFWLDDA